MKETQNHNIEEFNIRFVDMEDMCIRYASGILIDLEHMTISLDYRLLKSPEKWEAIRGRLDAMNR